MRISVWWVKTIHAATLGESWGFDGCILQFPYIWSRRSGKEGGKHAGIGAWTANCRV